MNETGSIGTYVRGNFRPANKSPRVDLLHLFNEAGWLEVYYACQSALALQDGNGRAAAFYLTKLRAMPESKAQAVTIAKLNTIIDIIHETGGEQMKNERIPFRRRTT
jgi:hypothetical protein